MSSATYKKAIQGRAHKERSQPSDRKKLGFLEKHKDYVLRAKDFHKKEKAIQVRTKRKVIWLLEVGGQLTSSCLFLCFRVLDSARESGVSQPR